MKFEALLGFLSCLRNRHDPIRKRVRKLRSDPTGKSFVSECQRCGKPIRRRASKTWVLDKTGRRY